MMTARFVNFFLTNNISHYMLVYFILLRAAYEPGTY